MIVERNYIAVCRTFGKEVEMGVKENVDQAHLSLPHYSTSMGSPTTSTGFGPHGRPAGQQDSLLASLPYQNRRWHPLHYCLGGLAGMPEPHSFNVINRKQMNRSRG